MPLELVVPRKVSLNDTPGARREKWPRVLVFYRKPVPDGDEKDALGRARRRLRQHETRKARRIRRRRGASLGDLLISKLSQCICGAVLIVSRISAICS